MEERALLLDTSRSAYPIYKSLVDSGLNVSVMGGNENDTLARLSRSYIKCDYSELGALDRYAEQFDYIVPGCNDVSYQVALLQDSKGLFFDRPLTYSKITNKLSFRETGHSLGLSMPKVLTRAEAIAKGQCIVKPVDSYSGRGITCIISVNEEILDNAIDKAKRVSDSGSYVIEDFVNGQLYSFSAFYDGCNITRFFIVREDCVTNRFAVDTSCLATCELVSIQGEIHAQIKEMANRLSLKPGLIHVQFIVDGESFWFIELARRCPGDLYPCLINLSTGFDYAGMYASQFCPRVKVRHCLDGERGYIIRHTATSSKSNVFWGIDFEKPIHIKHFIPLKQAGDDYEAGPKGRSGIYFFESSSKDEHENLYKDLLHTKLYRYSEGL